MLDLHSHLLPGIDDGAATMDEALDMARAAVANGIRHAVLTPHIHVGRYPNQRSTLQESFAGLQEALQQHEIHLGVSLGAEVRLSFEMLRLLEQDEIPMIGSEDGYRIMLLEFPHSHILPGTDKLIRFLLERNIRPMIAHPERNKELMRSLDKLVPFIEAGCLVQVTAGALCGNFGAPARLRAIEMLENGWVTILASDAHNLKYRPPELEPGRKVAEELIGRDAANSLVFDRPASILYGLGQRF